jgi:hypothetical protein
MIRPRLAVFLFCCAMLLGGCSADEVPEAGSPDTPEFIAQVASIARALTESPAAADSILQAHEMTRVQFDSLMYEIALDPMLTEAFEAARR